MLDQFDSWNPNDDWFFGNNPPSETDIETDISAEFMSLESDNRPSKAFESSEDKYTITSLEMATWAFERVQEAQKKQSEIVELADKEIERKLDQIKSWAEKEVAPLESQIAYFKAKLLEYYRAQAETDPKFKLTTPYGRVTKRTAKQWKYDDEKVLAFLKQNGKTDFIRIKEEVNKAELKKRYPDGVDDETGEIIDGVDIEKVTTIDIKVVE